MATVTVAAVALGIIVDDTVHILYRLRRELAEGRSLEEAMRRVAHASGVAVLSTSIVLFAGFLIMASAGTSAVANPGRLTAVAVFAALVTDLALLPAFASFVFEGRRRKESTPVRAFVRELHEEVEHDYGFQSIAKVPRLPGRSS
jgi:predicted RND superfamily exporter protein